MTTPLLERRQERVLRRLEEFRAWRNAREAPIVDWTFTASDGVPQHLRLKDFWPVHEVPVSLTATGTVPVDWAGQPVELELWLGGEARVNLSTGGLTFFSSQESHDVSFNLLMAASALVILPVVVMFMSFQRAFIEGVVTGGFK